MQSVSTNFTTKSKSNLRHIEWDMLASFPKNFDTSIDFFTIGTSLIGSTDIIKGTGSIVQEWDKYDYEDFGDRVLSIEYTREADPPVGALTFAMADVVLDNHDDLFTSTNPSSRFYGMIADGRPIRLYLGYEGVGKIQVFVGLTEGLPVIDDKAKTARFHCLDFLRYLQHQKLGQEVLLQDKRTDECILAVLTAAGLLTSQSSLDTGTVIIPFLYFNKDTTIGDALREITEAELGTLYMDESGMIIFENRTNWKSNGEVWQLDRSNTLELTSPDTSRVINLVEVFSKARKVEALQKIYSVTGGATFSDNTNVLLAGETKDIFVNFSDSNGELPVTTVNTPTANTITDSGYTANTSTDGSGTDMTSSVSVTSVSVFSTAMKLTFTNAHATLPASITRLELWGTPAKVQSNIYTIVKDDASIAAFEEQPRKIDNNYIQDVSAANSIAQKIIADRAEIDDQRTLVIKGIPQLQVGDIIRYTDSITNQTFFVTRINGILNTGGFKQNITVSKRTIVEYYAIGVSSIGSTHQIAP